MSAIRPLLCLALAALLGLTPGSSPGDATPAPMEDVQDLLFIGGPQPIFVRLHVRVGDKPLHAAWRDAIGKLHTYLDTDGNGTLTRAEAERVKWPQLVRVFLNSFRYNNSKVGLPGLDIRPEDGVVSVDELSEFLRTVRGPVLVETRVPAASEQDLTFARLDANSDGALGRDELEQAAEGFRKLDQNDDETISAAELMPFKNPFLAGIVQETAGSKPEPPVLLMGSNESRIRRVQQLLNRLDVGAPDGAKGKDHRLSRGEIGLGTEVFATYDGDGDGTLDSDELMQLLDQPEPALEVIVRIGKPGSKDPVVEIVGRPSQAASEMPGARVRATDQMVAAELGDVRLELRLDERAGNLNQSRQIFRTQLQNLDKDNDKLLTAAEVQGREPFQGLFAFMDHDGNGKLGEAEMNAALDLLDEMGRSLALLGITDRGGVLFGTLDTSGDGRLSVRELRAVTRRLADFDRDGDGRIASNEIPHRFEWVISPGVMTNLFGIRTFALPTPTPTPAARSPWFQKMDRNHDGDLSPREFLGPRAEFQRLDADADGLIDVREAKNAHQP